MDFFDDDNTLDAEDSPLLQLVPAPRADDNNTGGGNGDIVQFIKSAETRAACQHEAVCKLVENAGACMMAMQQQFFQLANRVASLESQFCTPAPALIDATANDNAKTNAKTELDNAKTELETSAARIEALNGVRLLRFLWQYENAGGAETYGGAISTEVGDRTLVSRSLLKELFPEIGGVDPARVTWDFIDHALFWVADPSTRPELGKAPLSSSKSFFEDRDLSRDRFSLRTDGPGFVRHPRVFACSTERFRWFRERFGVGDGDSAIATRIEDVHRPPRPFNSVRANGTWNWAAPFYGFEPELESNLFAPWHICFGGAEAKSRRGVGLVIPKPRPKRPVPTTGRGDDDSRPAPPLRASIGVIHDDGSVSYS